MLSFLGLPAPSSLPRLPHLHLRSPCCQSIVSKIIRAVAAAGRHMPGKIILDWLPSLLLLLWHADKMLIGLNAFDTKGETACSRHGASCHPFSRATGWILPVLFLAKEEMTRDFQVWQNPNSDYTCHVASNFSSATFLLIDPQRGNFLRLSLEFFLLEDYDMRVGRSQWQHHNRLKYSLPSALIVATSDEASQQGWVLAEVSPSAGEDVSIRHCSQHSLGQEEATAQIQPVKSLQALPKRKVRT